MICLKNDGVTGLTIGKKYDKIGERAAEKQVQVVNDYHNLAWYFTDMFEIVENNGGSTNYYKVPEGAKDLQDLIEHKNMNFALGNIFKAVYRLGECEHSEVERDLNKIIWFAERELKRLKAD